MKTPGTDDASRPLPREWLPEPRPADDSANWNAAVSRIMTVADPTLRALGAAAGRDEAVWWSVLGRWWTAAACLAGAAAAILVLAQPGPPGRPVVGSLPLNIMAAEGDPAALWEGLGVEADPVLALIALQPRER